jgi:biotin carboxyl carrier protein
MSLEYRVNQACYEVRLSRGDGGMSSLELSARAEDRTALQPTELLAVKLTPLGSRFVLTVGGKHHLGTLAVGKEGYQVSLGGQTFEVAAMTQHLSRRASVREAQTSITPPMPGQVIKILVEEGASVIKGQVVVVISAMKMESNLLAPYAGKVKAITTKLGAQVSPGEVLMQIQPEEAEAAATTKPAEPSARSRP